MIIKKDKERGKNIVSNSCRITERMGKLTMAHEHSHDKSQHLYLRDHLSIERTKMMNDQTLLSYIRTAVIVLAIGLTFTHLSASFPMKLTGWIFVLVSIVMVLVGYKRYRSYIHLIEESERHNITGIISIIPLTLAQLGAVGSWIMEKGMNIFRSEDEY